MSLDSLRARDVMRTDFITASPDTPVLEVFEALLRHESHSVLIVNQTRRLLGIVSERDVLSLLMVSEPLTAGLLATVLETRETIFEYLRQRIKSRSETAADIMMAPVVTVRSEDGLDRIVALMALKGLRQIPVAQDGRPLGTVSRSEVVAAIARLRLTPTRRAPRSS